MLKCSIPTLVRLLTMNGCWTLPNAFSASIEMIMWFLTFVLLMWYMMLIDLHMLNHPCEPGFNFVKSKKHSLAVGKCLGISLLDLHIHIFNNFYFVW